MLISLINALRGLLLGIACILPGMSAGVIALSMGLYQPMLVALVGFTSDVKRNIMFLAPIITGVIVGVYLTARVMSAVFQRAAGSITVLFVGFVLGGLPSLFAQAVRDESQNGQRCMRFRRWIRYVPLVLIGAGLMLLFGQLTRVASPSGAPKVLVGGVAVLSGAVYAFALIVPGISSSFLLLFLGLYQPMMDVLGHPLAQWRALLMVAVGGLMCCIILIQLMEWLLRRFPIHCRFIVIGFVLGSVWMACPWETFRLQPLIHLLLLGAGFTLASQFSRVFDVGHGTHAIPEPTMA